VSFQLISNWESSGTTPDHKNFDSSVRREGLIIAIGGGKGGVGKSFASVNLAQLYAQQGLKTLIVDLDLGSANAHTLLGVKQNSPTLSDFLRGDATQMEQIVTETDQENLFMISGSGDDLDIANVNDSSVERISSQIESLKYDIKILDLGAGTHNTTLSFFVMADHSLLVTNPDPTSLENAYRFLKAAFFKKFKNIEASFGVRKIVKEAMAQRNGLSIRRPKDLVTYLLKQEPHYSDRISDSLESLRIGIVMNQVRSKEDIELAESVTQICKNYFGFKASLYGYLDFDDAVWQSLRKRKTLCADCPSSHVVTQLQSVINFIGGKKSTKGQVAA